MDSHAPAERRVGPAAYAILCRYNSDYPSLQMFPRNCVAQTHNPSRNTPLAFARTLFTTAPQLQTFPPPKAPSPRRSSQSNVSASIAQAAVVKTAPLGLKKFEEHPGLTKRRRKNTRAAPATHQISLVPASAEAPFSAAPRHLPSARTSTLSNRLDEKGLGRERLIQRDLP